MSLSCPGFPSTRPDAYLVPMGLGTGTGIISTSGDFLTLLLMLWMFLAAGLVLSTTAIAMSSIPEAFT